MESQGYLHARTSVKVVVSFGAVRELFKGEVGTSTRVGYSFIVRESGGRTLAIMPRQGITEEYLAYAINHTCHPDFEHCNFLHTGVTKDPRGVGQEDEGGERECVCVLFIGTQYSNLYTVGGSHPSVVFVQTTRHVEREEEFFANYVDSFRFRHGCQCHLCTPPALSV